MQVVWYVSISHQAIMHRNSALKLINSKFKHDIALVRFHGRWIILIWWLSGKKVSRLLFIHVWQLCMIWYEDSDFGHKFSLLRLMKIRLFCTNNKMKNMEVQKWSSYFKKKKIHKTKKNSYFSSQENNYFFSVPICLFFFFVKYVCET